MKGDAAAFALVESGVVVDHEVFGGVVGDFPEADGLAFGSGDGEGAAEAVDAFAVEGCAEASFAGGEGDEFGACEVVVGFGGRTLEASTGGDVGDGVGFVECAVGADLQ